MKEAKVLFLGAAESGKSTLCRQIRILHGYKFSDEEIRHFKHYIRFSCLEHLITIIEDYLDDKEYQGTHGDIDMVEFLEQYKVRKDFERHLLYLSCQTASRVSNSDIWQSILQYDGYCKLGSSHT